MGLPPIWFGPRLAHGVPVGGELDYLDVGTLSAAIKQRTLF
jgi:recombination protein RecR